MAVGVPDRNAVLVQQVKQRYESDPTGWRRVAEAATELTTSATPDFLGRYGRDARALLAGYAPRITVACAN